MARPVHGVILDELRQYVAGRYGYRIWIETLKRSGHTPTQHYELDEVYPDDELALLARTAAEVTGTPAPVLLEGFGEALVPDMIRVYSFLIQPGWSYADFLLNMEPILVQALRLHTPGATQTKVHVRRLGQDSLEVVYESPLHACAAVEGVLIAAAREYGTIAEVVQTECVLRGDPRCLFTVHIEPRVPA
jgi:Haem-NO-binding